MVFGMDKVNSIYKEKQMAEIRINPDQVESIGNQFSSKVNELEALLAQSKTLVYALQATFSGQRAQAYFQDYFSLVPRIIIEINNLNYMADLLRRMASDFRSADSSR